MRTIRRTTQFKKDIKRMKKRGKDVRKLREVSADDIQNLGFD